MKINKIFLLSTLALGTFALSSCNDDDDLFNVVEVVPSYSVAAPTVGETYSTGVKLSSAFSGKDNAHYTKAGFCYAVGKTPTIYDATVNGTVTDGVITATVSKLAPAREYRFRAYVCEYNGATIYSDEVVVTTLEGTDDESLAYYEAPQYVDYYVDIAGWGSRAQWNLANVHDPTVMLADDGYYYMYQTDASYGNAHDGHGHFHGRRSKDLVNWEYLGATMPELPSWVNEKNNEIRKSLGLAPITVTDKTCGYWAPVARNLGNGTYRMYYSLVPGYDIEDGTNAWAERAYIGMMETTDPASNQWEDKGYVICSSSDRGKNWNVAGDWANAYYRTNAIDPSYIVTPEGDHWLVYGSWHSGIAALKVDAATGKPASLGNPWGDSAADIADYGTLIYTRAKNNRWQASEGPEVIYRNGYYYLFLAYDGLDVPYNTRVVRSKNITGPYLSYDGTDCTNNGGEAFPIVTHPYKFNGDQGWVGISHCAVFNDGADNWYFASQGRMPAGAFDNDAANAIMMGHVRSIIWTPDGWPVVLPERYGAVPQAAITSDEIAGSWEIIDLRYAYGKQIESFDIEFEPGGGDENAAVKWSFDPATNILSFSMNNADYKVTVARECDWEARPRTHTLVFGGLANNGSVTLWGKRN